MPLTEAYNGYVKGCACGKEKQNNCAHFLSNSLIKHGGYTELDGGDGLDERIVNGRLVCTKGRSLRAKELRDWAS